MNDQTADGNEKTGPATSTQVRPEGDERTATPNLFGIDRPTIIERGPDRRQSSTAAPDSPPSDASPIIANTVSLDSGTGRALRLGRGDSLAVALNALGIMLFVSTIVASGLIFNNARNVGAFSNPWNSDRVAIGFAVLALGIIHSALLVGVARALTYQLADLRLRLRATETVEPHFPPQG